MTGITRKPNPLDQVCEDLLAAAGELKLPGPASVHLVVWALENHMEGPWDHVQEGLLQVAYLLLDDPDRAAQLLVDAPDQPREQELRGTASALVDLSPRKAAYRLAENLYEHLKEEGNPAVQRFPRYPY